MAPDGTMGGGEVLLCDGAGSRSIARLEPVPLPGGDRCAQEGWRMAAAYGLDAPPPGVDSRVFHLVRMLAASGRVPRTSAAGGLLDAVASLLGLCQVSSYEGEAAGLLDAAADPEVTAAIDLELHQNRHLFAELTARHRRGDGAPVLAALLHNSLAAAIVRTCARAGARKVLLAGSCFRDRQLLERCASGLLGAGMEPLANARPHPIPVVAGL